MFSRSDELSRLAWIILVAITGIAINETMTFLLFSALPLAVMLSDARLFGAVLAERWRVVVFLPACLVFFHYFGQAFALTTGGSGLVPAGRLFLVVLLSLAFFRISDPRRLANGLHRLGLANKWAFAVYLGLRNVEVLRAAAQDIRDSIKLRLRGRRYGLISRIRMFARFVFLLVVTSLLKAEKTALAMDVRGFGLTPERSFIRSHEWTLYGILLCALTCGWIGVTSLVSSIVLPGR
jgi:energy-coupling factor transport system permease protein